jgi:hypothetical protein
MAEGAPDGKLTIRPLTPAHVDDLKTVTAGTWGDSCWCLFPRYTAAHKRERGLDKGGDAARRAEVARLARRRKAPGLIAYRGSEPVGWIAVGPRSDLSAVDRSRATPAVDERAVWVIPSITVRRGHRGEGIAVATIAAVEYATGFGAPGPRGLSARGQQTAERRLRVLRHRVVVPEGRIPGAQGAAGLPKSWTPRVALRQAVPKQAARTR